MTNITEPASSAMDIEDDAQIEKVRATAASPRTAVRGRPRGATREARSPSRETAQVVGRNGEILSRKRTATGDIFHIPPNLIPLDWEYQWAAISVTGNSEILMDQNLMLAENGWRPVPADRYPGRFMPEGHKGNIVRGGQMLMERPKALCEEARAEEYGKAYQQMRDRDESLMGSKANFRGSLGGGMEARGNTAYKGRRTQLSIDNAYDIPAPRHELAEPGE